MNLKEVIVKRLIEGLAPFTVTHELQTLSARVAQCEAAVGVIADTVHGFYGELLTTRELAADVLEAVEKPTRHDDIAYWIEELENSVLPELQRYLES